MRLGDLDALKKSMCELCNQDYSDEPCEPSDCVFIRVINEMPSLTPPNEWVSVEEKLPDFDTPVLVYVKDIFDNKGIINITKYTITYNLTNNWLGYENSSFKITHWMPLPEPPGKEE